MDIFGIPALLSVLVILLIIFGPGCFATLGQALRWWLRSRRLSNHADQQAQLQPTRLYADRWPR